MLPQSCCPLLSSKSEVTGGMGAHSHHSGCISGHSSDCPVQNLPYTRCPQRHIGLKYPQWLCVQGGKAVSDQGPQGAEVCSWHMPGVLAVALAEGANMAPLGLWFPGPGRVSLQPCVHRARQQSRHQPVCHVPVPGTTRPPYGMCSAATGGTHGSESTLNIFGHFIVSFSAAARGLKMCRPFI